ncbi:MAG: RNA ligase [Archangium sp.]|nr:RNA ligase [Archangium sp.]
MGFPSFPRIGTQQGGSSTRGPLLATEKVHGAQLVIEAGRAVRFGKRKAWLADAEPFFGWQLLRAALTESASMIRSSLGEDAILYGELFGGAYPHPDVAPVPGLQAVQTGVWYSPHLHWALFDVRVGDSFLAHDAVDRLAAEANVMRVPFVAKGTVAELESLPTRAPTRIPSALGLPPLADNFAEGLVIKPLAARAVTDAAPLKRKIAEFSEGRFDESAAFHDVGALGLEALWAHAQRCFTPGRLASARSKVGTDAAAVREEIVFDVLLDLALAFPHSFARLGAQEDALKARLTATADAAARGDTR